MRHSPIMVAASDMLQMESKKVTETGKGSHSTHSCRARTPLHSLGSLGGAREGPDQICHQGCGQRVVCLQYPDATHAPEEAAPQAGRRRERPHLHRCRTKSRIPNAAGGKSTRVIDRSAPVSGPSRRNITLLMKGSASDVVDCVNRERRQNRKEECEFWRRQRMDTYRAKHPVDCECIDPGQLDSRCADVSGLSRLPGNK